MNLNEQVLVEIRQDWDDPTLCGSDDPRFQCRFLNEGLGGEYCRCRLFAHDLKIIEVDGKRRYVRHQDCIGSRYHPSREVERLEAQLKSVRDFISDHISIPWGTERSLIEDLRALVMCEVEGAVERTNDERHLMHEHANKLEQMLTRAKKVLRDVEWSGETEWSDSTGESMRLSCCPWCGALMEHSEAGDREHTEDCALAHALRDREPMKQGDE